MQNFANWPSFQYSVCTTCINICMYIWPWIGQSCGFGIEIDENYFWGVWVWAQWVTIPELERFWFFHMNPMLKYFISKNVSLFTSGSRLVREPELIYLWLCETNFGVIFTSSDYFNFFWCWILQFADLRFNWSLFLILSFVAMVTFAF